MDKLIEAAEAGNDDEIERLVESGVAVDGLHRRKVMFFCFVRNLPILTVSLQTV